jgi:hypothetical protein
VTISGFPANTRSQREYVSQVNMERAAFSLKTPAPTADHSDRPERLAYRVRETAEMLAISQSHFHELVTADRIRVLKDPTPAGGIEP